MKYKKLGKSGIEISVIGHGTWGMGNDIFGEVDENSAIKSLHASIDAGVNFIDTAAVYGEDRESEKLVGKALSGRRDQVVLATKVGVLRYEKTCYVNCLKPEVIRIELEKSLKALRTDYVDLYQIHWPDNNTPIERTVEELARMKEEGKIRAIGVSNYSVEQIKTASKVTDIASAQPQLNLLNRNSVSNGIIPHCEANDIAVLTYGSLAGGVLSGKMSKMPEVEGKEKRGTFYPFYREPMWSKVQELLAELNMIAEKRNVPVAEVSINWVLAQSGVTCALLGTTNPERALQNAKAADWSLEPEELDMIEKACTRIFKK